MIKSQSEANCQATSIWTQLQAINLKTYRTQPSRLPGQEHKSNMTFSVARAGVEVHTTSVANGIVVKPHMELRRSMRFWLIATKTVSLVVVTVLTEPLHNLSTVCLPAAGQCYIQTHVKRKIYLTDCARLTVMPRITRWCLHGFVSHGCAERRS